MNQIRSNNAPPANLAKFFATQGKWLPASDAKDFAKVAADAKRLIAERTGHAPTVLETRLQSLRNRAAADPSEEVIRALSDFTVTYAESKRTSEQIVSEIVTAHGALLRRAKPLFKRIAETALPLVEAEMSRIDAAQAELAAGVGAPYVSADSLTLCSIARWIDQVNEILIKDTPGVVQVELVEQFLGPIAPGKGLFG